MDKIVDHLFVFRGEGEIEDFPGNYSDFRAYEDSAEPVKEEPKEKVNWKQDQPKKAGLSFNEQKEYSKIEREIKDLEHKKKQIEDAFSNGTFSDDELITKGIELQKTIDSLEEKELRWFELSEKLEE